MDTLHTVLARVERDIRDRRAAIESITDSIDAMQSMGFKVAEEQQTVRTLEAELAQLSLQQSTLTRTLRTAQMKCR